MRYVSTTALMLTVAVTAAHAETITFSEGSLSHGTVLAQDFFNGGSGPDLGVTIKVNNKNTPTVNDPGVIFDTTLESTRDPDLEDPWSGGNLPASTDFGNALIIQEKGVSSSTPDDEGRRPAGTITFLFDNPIDSFGFDFLDFELTEASDSFVVTVDQILGASNKSFSINFMDFVTDTSAFFVDENNDNTADIQFGNNTANRLPLITLDDLPTKITEINKITIKLGGSGAIDNFTFTEIDGGDGDTSAVPTPGAFAGGLALLGLASLRRR